MKEETSKCPKCGRPKYKTVKGAGDVIPFKHKNCPYNPSQGPGPNPNINYFAKPKVKTKNPSNG